MGRWRIVACVVSAALAGACGGDGPAINDSERADLEGLLDIEITDEVLETVCGFDRQPEAIAYLFSLGVKETYPSGFKGEYAAGRVAHTACDEKADRWDLQSLGDMIDDCEKQPAEDPCHEAIDGLNDAVLDAAD